MEDELLKDLAKRQQVFAEKRAINNFADYRAAEALANVNEGNLNPSLQSRVNDLNWRADVAQRLEGAKFDTAKEAQLLPKNNTITQPEAVTYGARQISSPVVTAKSSMNYGATETRTPWEAQSEQARLRRQALRSQAQAINGDTVGTINAQNSIPKTSPNYPSSPSTPNPLYNANSPASTPQVIRANPVDISPNNAIKQAVDQSKGLYNAASPTAKGLAGNVAQFGAGLVGSNLGQFVGNSAFGTNSGIGSQIGSAIGGITGSFLGAGLAAVPSLGMGAFGGGVIGAGFGSFVGAVIGSAFDALGNAIWGDNSKKANPVNDKGQGYRSGSMSISGAGQSVGVAYNILVQMTFADGTVQYSWGSNAGSSVDGLQAQRASYTGAILGSRFQKQGGLTSYYFTTSNGEVLGGTIFNRFFSSGFAEQETVGFTILQINRVDGQPDLNTGNQSPNANTPYTPIASQPSEKVPAENPALSPNYFPYFPTVTVAGTAADTAGEAAARNAPAPFIGTPDETKPSPDVPRQIAPVSPTPPPTPASPLLNTSPAFSDKPATPISSGSSGIASFEAKPFESGKSNPSEQTDPVDVKTGLTRSQFQTMLETAAAENTLKAAAFDKKESDKLKVQKVTTAPPSPNGFPVTSNNLKTDALPKSDLQSITQQTTPNTPSQGTTPDAVQTLGAIAGIAATLAAVKVGSDYLVNNSLSTSPKIDTILNQTSPTNQQTNAATGACTALNSATCTTGLKDSIVSPINANTNAQQVASNAKLDSVLAAIANLGSTIATLFSNVVGKLDGITDLVGRLWNNGLIDKVMQYITMITVIHNAAMLSRGIADTLGSALDSGLQALGLVIKDKDGNQQGVTAIIGKSFENLIKGIIGTANYTALTETWIQANRIYQTGINLVSNVQSILDSTTAVAELTSNRVGTLMNALRNSGMVRENAYGAQSQNVTKFNAFQNKLENLEQGVSNVASIAGNIVSVQQSVNELKNNRTEFDKAVKNKPVGTGIGENDPEKLEAKSKKDQSIYTIGDFSVVKPPETP